MEDTVRNRIPRLLVGALVGLALSVPAPSAASVDTLLANFQMVPLGGQRPPAVSLPTVDGQSVKLEDFSGRVVLLYFWATW